MLRKKRIRLTDLPAELLVRIFCLAQNPRLPTTCKIFWQLGESPWVRAHYLLERFGTWAALGERAMASPIVARCPDPKSIIEQLLVLGSHPRADGDYLLWKACSSQDVSLCTTLMDAIGPSEATVAHFLNVAAMQGATRIVDLLVERYGANVHEDRVLMVACSENQVSMVQHLIETYGCDVHANRERHLRRACLHGHSELVSLLLSQKNVDIHVYNDAALQNAAYKGHTDVVGMLLDAGADAATNRNAPLKYAVATGNVDVAQRLLEAGADACCRDNWPIRHAARRRSTTDMVGLLLQHGADPDAMQGMPLREALRCSCVPSVELLLRHGADPASAGAIRGVCEAMLERRQELVGIMAAAGTPLTHPYIDHRLKEARRRPPPIIVEW